ncbi:unnamed protein product [Mytilus edulis]|uniref:Uncharacterized protein n=1 Tax=Mytilus edulis TaxID=6550 RepID=A0A8S3VAG4_MYTED|nr:unnamed protein product [Mytilus edulis]
MNQYIKHLTMSRILVPLTLVSIYFRLTRTLPKNNGDVEKIKACKRGFLSCCDNEFQIDVKNCGTFNVYHLSPLSSCMGRYCTVGKAKCKPGTSSESGYEPCHKADITFNVKPRIIPHIPATDFNDTERQLTFRCTGNYYSYRTMTFDIKYMIDGIEIPSNTSNLSHNEILTKSKYRLFNVERLSQATAEVINALIFLVKLVNPQVTVFAGESAKIDIVSTVPVACYTIKNRRGNCLLSFEMHDFKEDGNDACNSSETTPASACGLIMNGWNWNSPTSMYVTTLRNLKYQSEYTAIVKLRCTTEPSISYGNI